MDEIFSVRLFKCLKNDIFIQGFFSFQVLLCNLNIFNLGAKPGATIVSSHFFNFFFRGLEG